MIQKSISYNDLPEAISEILSRISNIESIVKAPHATEQKEELLNAKQAADLLQIALPTLYNKVSNRDIPHIKKHKRLVFHRSELMEYLNTGRRRTTEESDAHNITIVNQALTSKQKKS